MFFSLSIDISVTRMVSDLLFGMEARLDTSPTVIVLDTFLVLSRAARLWSFGLVVSYPP